MKKFEKWWKKNHYTHYDDRAYKVGWRAALEWVSTFTISESIKKELKS